MVDLQGKRIKRDKSINVLVGLAWIAKNAYYQENEELGLLRKTPLNPYIIGYIVVCFFCTGMGMIADRVNIKTGFFFVLKYFEYIIVYFILVNHLHHKKQVKNYTTVILLTCLIVCIVAAMQIPGGMRVTAPFEGAHGEPNTLGIPDPYALHSPRIFFYHGLIIPEKCFGSIFHNHHYCLNIYLIKNFLDSRCAGNPLFSSITEGYPKGGGFTHNDSCHNDSGLSCSAKC